MVSIRTKCDNKVDLCIHLNTNMFRYMQIHYKGFGTRCRDFPRTRANFETIICSQQSQFANRKPLQVARCSQLLIHSILFKSRAQSEQKKFSNNAGYVVGSQEQQCSLYGICVDDSNIGPTCTVIANVTATLRMDFLCSLKWGIISNKQK